MENKRKVMNGVYLSCGGIVMEESKEQTLKIEVIIKTEPVNSNIPAACRGCANHPSNGGSGICHCTLGSPQVIY